ncbi:MAG: hypothetical protein ACOYMN_17390, partial [Roseimicrobium sp.]
MKFEHILPRFIGTLLLYSLNGFTHAQVTTRTDSTGKLLNEWHARGSAAGLGALSYENRDGGHSLINTMDD